MQFGHGLPGIPLPSLQPYPTAGSLAPPMHSHPSMIFSHAQPSDPYGSSSRQQSSSSEEMPVNSSSGHSLPAYRGSAQEVPHDGHDNPAMSSKRQRQGLAFHDMTSTLHQTRGNRRKRARRDRRGMWPHVSMSQSDPGIDNNHPNRGSSSHMQMCPSPPSYSSQEEGEE